MKPQASTETPKSEETAHEFPFSAICGLKSLQINLPQSIKALQGSRDSDMLDLLLSRGRSKQIFHTRFQIYVAQ